MKSRERSLHLLALLVVILAILGCSLSGSGDATTPPNDSGGNVPDDTSSPVDTTNNAGDTGDTGDTATVESPTATEEPVQEPTATTEPTNTPDPEPLNTTYLLPALKNIALRPEDLDFDYKLINDKEVDNVKAATTITWTDGKQYAAKTGRLNGWNTYMERMDPNDYTPTSYRSRIEVFKTNEGAASALGQDWFFVYNDPTRVPSEWISENCAFGDECIEFMYRENIAGTTDFVVEYDIAYRYRNVVVWVFAKGYEKETTEQHVLDIAQIILERLETYQ